MSLLTKITKFFHNEHASVAVIFAFSLPAMAMVAGLATDYVAMTNQQSKLQSIADAAAVAAAKEYSLANSDAALIIEVAKRFANQRQTGGTSAPLEVTVSVDDKKAAISVTLIKKWRPFFLHYLTDGVTPIAARATARVVGSEKICVLGLDKTAPATISLTQKAQLQATNCGVYSNSSDTGGVSATKLSMLQTQLTCSVGGVNGTSDHFTPQPITDCPVIADPLVDRSPPNVGHCDFNDTKIEDSIVTLSPGVYCGGLAVRNRSQVTFAPGIYIIKDGEFRIDSNASVKGEYVGFYFTGKDSTLRLASNASASLSAPKTGAMAGLLMFEDRAAPPCRYTRSRATMQGYCSERYICQMEF